MLGLKRATCSTTPALCHRHTVLPGVYYRAAAGSCQHMFDRRSVSTQANSGSGGMPGSSSSSGGDVPSPSKAAAAASKATGLNVTKYVKLSAGLATLYTLDMGIKKAFIAAGITFPSALGGMFFITGLLVAIGEERAAALSDFFAPMLTWIARWLPLFYVASLVTLPLGLKGISGEELGKVFIILLFGMAGTLLFTAQTAVLIRGWVKTENKEMVKAKPNDPYRREHFLAWGAVAATSLIATLVNPTAWGPTMAMPWGLAITVLGYLIGCAVPVKFQGILHPVCTCAIFGNVGAALHGSILGLSYDAAQKAYYSKGVGMLGAGDVLMSFLGCVIISFGFRIYQQRETMRRHAPEILGATLLSSLFSFFSTAFAAKALGLPAALARALIPRSVTVALALPIGQSLDAPLSIVAAAVLLQGLLGANFGPQLMTACGIKDTIARGLAAAGTAGGLGTASLTSKEPEALPFCALSYSMVGILSTVLASTPLVRNALIAIVA